MKVSIEGDPKEIAAFVLELQKRRNEMNVAGDSYQAQLGMKRVSVNDLPGPLVGDAGIGEFWSHQLEVE